MAKTIEGDHVAVPRRLETLGSATLPRVRDQAAGVPDRRWRANRDCAAIHIHQRGDCRGLRAVGTRVRRSATDAKRQPSTHRRPSWRIVSDEDSRDRRADFAGNLDATLRSRGRTAAWLAEAVGVSPASVTHWGNAQLRPDAKTFDRICEVLEVRGDDLALARAHSEEHSQCSHTVSRRARPHGRELRCEVRTRVDLHTSTRLARTLPEPPLRDGWLGDGACIGPVATRLFEYQRKTRPPDPAPAAAVRHHRVAPPAMGEVPRFARPSWQIDITDPISNSHSSRRSTSTASRQQPSACSSGSAIAVCRPIAT